MSTRFDASESRLTWKSRCVRVPLTIGVIGSLLLAACSSSDQQNSDPTSPGQTTQQSEQQVQNPTHVLQNVNLKLASNGNVSAIDTNNIYVNEQEHKSSSKTINFKVKDVINDVPVRVSTQYQSSKGTGTNLKDLNGYSGELTIKVTVENLTLKSQEVSYDAGGTKRTNQALVGVPFTVAGSVSLDNVKSNQIITSGDKTDDSATNGVISTTGDGKANVQWGAILAPPTSGASTSFTLKVNAQDFKAPDFDIAVQPGFASDLSGESVLNNSFNKNDANQVAMLQRTIDLVNNVDSTITSASSQVNELRSSLDNTSDTLGQDAAKNLQANSESLTKRMAELDGQIQSLKDDLAKTADGNKNQLISQLESTVNTMDTLLGDTSQVPNVSVSHQNGSCTVDRGAAGGGSSVYGNLVQLSQILNNYADASGDCQRALADSLRQTIGPDNPSPEVCRDGSSVTCSLYGASVTSQASLIGLVANGEKLVNELQPEYLKGANKNYRALRGEVDNLTKYLQSDEGKKAIRDHQQNGDVTESLKSSRRSVDELKKTSDELTKALNSLHSKAVAARNDVSGNSNSIDQQNEDIANELCKLSVENGGKLSQEEVDRLRSYLTSTPCGETPRTPQRDQNNQNQGDQNTPNNNQNGNNGNQNNQNQGNQDNNQNTPNNNQNGQNDQNGQGGAQVTPQNDPTENGQNDQNGQNQNTPNNNQNGNNANQGGTPVVPAAHRFAADKLQAPEGYGQAMDERLNNQARAWDEVIKETDLQNPTTPLAQNAKGFSDQVNSLDSALSSVEKAYAGEGDDQNRDRDDRQNDPNSLDEKLKALTSASDELGKNLDELSSQHSELSEALKNAFKDSADETSKNINNLISQEIRQVSAQGSAGADSIQNSFTSSIYGLAEASNVIVRDAGNSLEAQRRDIAGKVENLKASLDGVTQSSLEQLDARTGNASRDLAGASVLLADDLNKVILDLGDSRVDGSGLLGALKTNAAKAGAADFQLALASQNAQGYTSVRAEDIAAVQLRQAQFKASLEKLKSLPSFHLPDGGKAEVKVVYTFHIGDM
ncbi:MAG: 1,4-beta-xylanase [Rothia dentocariosa]|uniref:1,4-beta-xylanase n=1 Tax=Rothia sp. HMSC036D11 TaxID=1739462 RepID=UPI0008A4ED89|nr:1,4-beta-xylanase [Rothia sp. HMSC036D11]OFQ03915.1 1,4-beta-xylanase [Rothia sp. HMSC036D11]